MNRLHRGLRILALGAVLTGSIAATSVSPAYARQATPPDASLRGKLAAITLDQEALPNGYAFVGEAFLTAEQVASGSVDATALTDAGFVSQYVSVYENSGDNSRIRSYVSAWNDENAAKTGFDVLENEANAAPDGTFADGETSVGDEPRELTTGTFPEGDATITTADVTFRSGSFLVGVSLETTDGTVPDPETAQALAKTSFDRATSVASGQNPPFTDLALPAQTLPLASLGAQVQAGFLSPGEAETIYGVQGSALSKLTASWTETVGVGTSARQLPYVTVGVTTFENADAAKAVVTSATDITPALTNGKAVENPSVNGADATAAYTFTSSATGGDTADSHRIIFSKGASLVVIDVQGAPTEELATQAATGLAASQISCLGAGECAAPQLPDGLAG